MIQVDLWSTGYRGDIVQLPLVQAMAPNGALDQRIVFSDEGPSRLAFEATGLPYLTVAGNQKILAAPRTLARVMRARSGLRSWYAHRRPIVHITMKSLWDHFYIDIPKRMGATILLTIHDAQQHIGDESRIWALSEKRLLRLADHIAVLSRYAGQRLRERIGDARPIHVVAPGLVMNSAPPGPARPTPTNRPVKFLFFGRIRKYKGLDFVLDAWRMIQDRSEIPHHLTIAGSGDVAEYSAAISSLKNVELIHGWTSDELMARLFATHDVNLLPYREGSSSATSLAGMWAGMPSIATPIEAFHGQLLDGVNAVIMRDVSGEALAEAMLRLAESPALYAKLARGAHNHAHSLSAPVVAEAWRELYDQIWTAPRVTAR